MGLKGGSNYQTQPWTLRWPHTAYLRHSWVIFEGWSQILLSTKLFRHEFDEGKRTATRCSCRIQQNWLQEPIEGTGQRMWASACTDLQHLCPRSYHLGGLFFSWEQITPPNIWGEKSEIPQVNFTISPNNLDLQHQVRKSSLPNPSFPMNLEKYDSQKVPKKAWAGRRCREGVTMIARPAATSAASATAAMGCVLAASSSFLFGSRALLSHRACDHSWSSPSTPRAAVAVASRSLWLHGQQCRSIWKPWKRTAEQDELTAECNLQPPEHRPVRPFFVFPASTPAVQLLGAGLHWFRLIAWCAVWQRMSYTRALAMAFSLGVGPPHRCSRWIWIDVSA